MVRLEELKPGTLVKGVLPNQHITVIAARWLGTVSLELTYRAADGTVESELLYRANEPSLEIVTASLPWRFDGDGENFRLVSEAYRIQLAHLFDPRLAVHISQVKPLPHQITAVYEEMLPRQPLRYLLADDPGAGKTIMTGLYLKELLVRGDLKRCMVVCPGNLVEQWQAELYDRFDLQFEIFTRDKFKTATTGNLFQEENLLLCRLDQLSRSEEIQAKLKTAHWDIIVCDEAHKMSAPVYGNKTYPTKRYQLGELLGKRTRHFLLLTATPHNGKEADFQRFMALLDPDRFEGHFREDVHTVDTSDLMRRMVKEDLLKFDGTRLFPDRFAYTVNYALSESETELYDEVTAYVREEMNRADQIAGQRGNRIGFALTILQRRLASSPEAIYCSIQRRRQRLEERLQEEKQRKTDVQDSLAEIQTTYNLPTDTEQADEFYDEVPAEEIETLEEKIVAHASAARTITELQAEIQKLQDLEKLALQVRRKGTDRKWDELSKFLQKRSDATAADALFDAQGHRRKLIIFTEHRDTLRYLADRIQTVIGRADALVTIHGGLRREERQKAQEKFTHDPAVQILVATDAAGEGINLHCAHLMVNYDLPWNPNRVEQRFGRIHRIGQTEVCHLWNIVAAETREGQVFDALFQKLERQRQALGGVVFDVLGKCFSNRSLRELLIDAVREADTPEVKARLTQVIDTALDRDHLQALIEEHALTHGTMDTTQLDTIRDEMDRAEARRLQPHFIASFFRAAFAHLGGTLREREPKRYEIRNVPAVIRNRDVGSSTHQPLLRRYERITFEKDKIHIHGKPPAAFVCPGHPLLDATLELVLERHRALLKRGTVLVDPDEQSDEVRVLFYLEHTLQDGRVRPDGKRQVVSRQMQFVEIDSRKVVSTTGYAPYLDYRAVDEDKNEQERVEALLKAEWLAADLEAAVINYAVEHLVPAHLEDIKTHKERLVEKTREAVETRLKKEINYWDNRAYDLEQQEVAGKQTARLNAAQARQNADELQMRLEKRMEELQQELRISPRPPIVIGGALIVPQRLLDAPDDQRAGTFHVSQADRERIDRLAIAAVLATERRLGREPKEMPHGHPGYDIESRDPATQKLLFIEVKGKSTRATTVTVSKTQIFTAFNKPEHFVLAIVEVDGDTAKEPRYIRKPFEKEPDFGVTSVNYNLSKLLERSKPPG